MHGWMTNNNNTHKDIPQDASYEDSAKYDCDQHSRNHRQLLWSSGKLQKLISRTIEMNSIGITFVINIIVIVVIVQQTGIAAIKNIIIKNAAEISKIRSVSK